MSKIVVHGFNTWPNIEYKYNSMIRQHIDGILINYLYNAPPPCIATNCSCFSLIYMYCHHHVLIWQHHRSCISARCSYGANPATSMHLEPETAASLLPQYPPSRPAQHGADIAASMHLCPGPCSSTRSSLLTRSHGW